MESLSGNNVKAIFQMLVLLMSGLYRCSFPYH